MNTKQKALTAIDYCDLIGKGRKRSEHWLPPFCPMVQTHYIGPTDTKGGRAVAVHMNTKKRAVVAWDHSKDVAENHLIAALMVLDDRMGEWEITSRCSVDGGGYIFACSLKVEG